MTHAFGRLLMVGLGPGTDLMFLPAAVTSVAAVEPVAVMRRTASRLALRHGIAADIVEGTGESIPFPDDSFDSVHIGLVLCSVDDVAATLSEIRRVLKPGGRLVVLEHVRGDGLWAGSRTWSPSLGRGWPPVASRTDAPSTPLRRPDSIPRNCAASREPRCRSRANLICKDSPPGRGWSRAAFESALNRSAVSHVTALTQFCHAGSGRMCDEFFCVAARGHSARIYPRCGSGPMLAAAASWDGFGR